MQLRMIVEEDAMSDDQVRSEDFERVEPLDRGLAMTPGDLIEFHDRLRRVQLGRYAALAGFSQAFTQQTGAAGVDLRRPHHAAEAGAEPEHALQQFHDRVQRHLGRKRHAGEPQNAQSISLRARCERARKGRLADPRVT